MAAAIEVKLQGMDAARRLVAAVGERRAERLVRSTLVRIGRSIRAELVREMRQQAPSVPAKELRSRVSVSPIQIRIYGAGKRGSMFIRPRHLQARQSGSSVTWGPGGAGTTAERAWLAMPVAGSKVAGKGSAGDKRGGRNYVLPGRKTGFKASRAVVVQRVGASRYPVRIVRDPWTAGLLMARSRPTAQIAGQLAQRVAAELDRLVAVELERAAR